MNRIRITFSKFDNAIWIGNLDLHRMWARVFRRNGMPIAYSQGFNPQPRIQFASALPLGLMSKCEILDVWLTEYMSVDEIKVCLSDSLPRGIEINDIKMVDLKEKSLQSQLSSVEYSVYLDGSISRSELLNCVSIFMVRDQIQRKLRGKEYDLRPLVESLDVNGCNDSLVLVMRLTSKPSKTGRAGEVLDELGINSKNIVRSGLFFVDNDE